MSEQLRAELTLMNGDTYEASVEVRGEMNTKQKFLSKLQSDGGLWVSKDHSLSFIPWHAILMVDFDGDAD